MNFKQNKINSKGILILRSTKPRLKKDKEDENITTDIRNNKKAVKRK